MSPASATRWLVDAEYGRRVVPRPCPSDDPWSVRRDELPASGPLLIVVAPRPLPAASEPFGKRRCVERDDGRAIDGASAHRARRSQTSSRSRRTCRIPGYTVRRAWRATGTVEPIAHKAETVMEAAENLRHAEGDPGAPD